MANSLEPVGGLERVQLRIFEGLHARGHRTALVYERDGSLSPAWEACTTSRRRTESARLELRRPVRAARAAAALTRALLTDRPDVVYLHHYRHLHGLLPALRARPTPVVLHLHSAAPTGLGPIGRRAVRAPDRVLAVSAHAAAAWRPFRPDIAAVLNGLDLGHFRPPTPERRRAAREALRLDPDCFAVGFAGRLSPEKGVTSLLDAWQKAGWPPGRAQLLIAGAGEGRFEEALRRGVPDDVRFLGFVPDTRDLYDAVDAAVVPSTWPDPCPAAVIEALACGIPVVASRIGGIPELLPPGGGDWLVTPDRPDELADALRDLADDVSRRALAGHAARAHAEATFDIDAMVTTVDALLATVVSEEVP